ncbi:MAG: FAD-dependent monooxygenase, partial [Terracidiphilus sp.]
MRVVIIGAGIGGLATAAALRRVGIPSLVLEQAAAITEVGAGLSIWPNAVHALEELGLREPVMAAASVIERNLLRTAGGRTIGQTELAGLSKIAGAPCICLHRVVLQKILLDALPSDWVRTGARCSRVDGATAILESGERIEADVLIGADGISSIVREALHGAEEPRYAGYTGWRGICADNGLLPERSPMLVVGAGSQFGAWPCGDGQFYWFLTKNVPPRTRQTKADALALCRNWAAPVPQIIAATLESAILRNDILDRPPLKAWGRGSVTLLGDAAHATT